KVGLLLHLLVEGANSKCARNFASGVTPHAVTDNIDPEAFVDEEVILVCFTLSPHVCEGREGNLRAHARRGYTGWGRFAALACSRAFPIRISSYPLPEPPPHEPEGGYRWRWRRHSGRVSGQCLRGWVSGRHLGDCEPARTQKRHL